MFAGYVLLAGTGGEEGRDSLVLELGTQILPLTSSYLMVVVVAQEQRLGSLVEMVAIGLTYLKHYRGEIGRVVIPLLGWWKVLVALCA